MNPDDPKVPDEGQRRESFAALFDATRQDSGRRGPGPRVGEQRDVTVIKMGRDAVFVSLDGKEEGFIERSAFAGKDANLAVGMRIVARVAELGGKAGATRLVPLVVKGDSQAVTTTEDAGPVVVEGVRVKGAVTRVERYGVFVQIAGVPGRKGRGLIPAAETGSPRGTDLAKAFPIGKEVEAIVLSVGEDGKVRLSIVALAADAERADFTTYASGAQPAGGGAKKAAASLGTFADLLGAKKQKK